METTCHPQSAAKHVSLGSGAAREDEKEGRDGTRGGGTTVGVGVPGSNKKSSRLARTRRRGW